MSLLRGWLAFVLVTMACAVAAQWKIKQIIQAHQLALDGYAQDNERHLADAQIIQRQLPALQRLSTLAHDYEAFRDQLILQLDDLPVTAPITHWQWELLSPYAIEADDGSSKRTQVTRIRISARMVHAGGLSVMHQALNHLTPNAPNHVMGCSTERRGSSTSLSAQCILDVFSWPIGESQHANLG